MEYINFNLRYPDKFQKNTYIIVLRSFHFIFFLVDANGISIIFYFQILKLENNAILCNLIQFTKLQLSCYLDTEKSTRKRKVPMWKIFVQILQSDNVWYCYRIIAPSSFTNSLVILSLSFPCFRQKRIDFLG